MVEKDRLYISNTKTLGGVGGAQQQSAGSLNADEMVQKSGQHVNIRMGGGKAEVDIRKYIL